MFDIGWTELLVIAVVAIVVIGPKDLPRVMRTVGQWAGKLKRMSREFQGQFNEALREAELEDVRKDVEAISKGLKEDVAKASQSVNSIGDDIKKAADVSTPAAPTTPSEPVTAPETSPAAETPAPAEAVPPAVEAPAPVETVPPVAEPAAAAAEVKP